ANDGISFALATFANNQRFFSIYDGPAYEDSNAYLDITRANLPNDPILGCNPQPSTDPSPDHNCANSVYSQAGKMLGMPYDSVNNVCYLPNAAIAWKQPNGFYYPPAFHSTNLFFDNVAIRHYVIEPQFEPGTYKTNFKASQARYCNAETTMFNPFTDIDRQTELNDDDGSLTGLENTVSINEDPFFSSPTEDTECASDVSQNPAGTARTS